MNDKFFILFFLLFFISCLNSKKVNPCYCLEILLKNNNEKWEECIELSRENNFIIKMRDCENYNNFIKIKLEENYKKLINPENISIENITN